MEQKTKIDKKTVGVIGLLTVLAVFGGSLYFTDSQQIDASYYCIGSGEFGVFYGGISGTGLTAYPYEENRSDYVRCYYENGVKSEWVPLIEYASELNVTVEELLEQEPPQIVTERVGQKYVCDTQNCTLIE